MTTFNESDLPEQETEQQPLADAEEAELKKLAREAINLQDFLDPEQRTTVITGPGFVVFRYSKKQPD
jgi:hypothetical protein